MNQTNPEHENLSKLGEGGTNPNRTLETFPNRNAERDYVVELKTNEFTCLCPKTGQPDFATIKLEYVPEDRCIELKALKLYLWSYRDQGAFHEAVTNKILEDLVTAMQPRYLRITSDFNVRGGLYTDVVAEHTADGWVPSSSLLNSLNNP